LSSIRTFIAIELAPHVLDALEEIQARLRDGEGGRAGRWVKRENMHLTLKFLGQVPFERLEDVYRAVARACEGCHPFVLTWTELECFPNTRRPRVICVGVREGTGQLAEMHGALERELDRIGFPPERRRFKPHLTLGRVRKKAVAWEVKALAEAAKRHRETSVARCDTGEAVQMRVSAVSVVRSDLGPKGPVYTQLFEALLTGCS